MVKDIRIPLENGTILSGTTGSYKVESIKGYGGSSLVYSGHHREHQVPVLIKELYPIDSNNLITRSTNGNDIEISSIAPAVLKMQAEEILKTSKSRALNEQKLHAELAKKFYPYNELILDSFEKNKTIYTIFANKDDSYVLSHEKKQSFKTYLIYTKRILEALIPLHQAGYLHLDISPDNIYKTKMGASEPILRLIDFNSAMKLSEIRETTHIYSKYEFAPYEVKTMNTNKIGYASDIYSVAACLFFWLNGRAPNVIDSTNPLSINDHQNDDILPSYILNKVNVVLSKALQSNANKRYQSANEMLEDINEIINETTDSSISDHSTYSDIHAKLQKIESSISSIKTKYDPNKRLSARIKSRKVIYSILAICVLCSFILFAYQYNKKPKQIIHEDGSVYVGELLNGVEHGFGKITYANGDQYEGYWENGLYHGQGTLIDSEVVYIGSFNKGIEHGFAEITHNNEEDTSNPKNFDLMYYKGDIRNGLFHGYGEAQYANGDQYKGDFEHGYFHGIGEYYSYNNGDGWTFSGQYELGYQKRGQLKYHSTGVYYYGSFDNNAGLTGFGSLSYPSGLRLEGYFENWMLQGKVKLSRDDGAVAYAQFLDNKPIEDIIYKDTNNHIVEIVTLDQMNYE